MVITRRLAIGGAVAFAPAIIGRAKAAATRMRVSTSLPNDAKFSGGRVYFDNLAKQIAANKLEDQISVSFFPDNQLGQEIDVVNSVKLGVIDLMISGSSIWANLVPSVGVLDLGYLFQTIPHSGRAMDAGAAAALEQIVLKGANVHMIGWAYNFGARSVLCKTPVHTPEDLSGKKIRTLPNPVITEVLRLMGAAATPLALGEVYTALQAGVLDGMEHDAPTILSAKLFEAAKNYSLTEHIISPLCLTMSDVAYKRMAAPLREGFMDAVKKATADTRAHGLAVEQEAKDALRSRGVTIIEVDKDPFRKRVLPQTARFLEAHPDVKPVLDIVRSTAG
jgi:TRAP-type C4-dicarboxylate transport system substrate-binding protein